MTRGNLTFAGGFGRTAFAVAAMAWMLAVAQPSIAQSLSFQGATGAPGSGVDVGIVFTAGSTAVSAMQFDVSLSPSLSYVSATAGPAATSANKGLTANQIGSSVRIIIVGLLNNTTIQSGTVASIRLNIAPGASLGLQPVNVTAASVSDPNGRSFPIGDASGRITVATVVDNTAPRFVTSSVANITATAATITWATDEAADGRVEYGTTASYGQSVSDSSMATQHILELTGLTAGTTYQYRLRSRDAAGNEAVSGNFSFTTTGGGSGAGSPDTAWYPGLGLALAGNPAAGEEMHMGVAVTNLDDKAATLRFSAVDNDGALVRRNDLTNPVLRTLDAGRQVPLVDTQIFGAGISMGAGPGVFRLEGLGSKSAALFMLFNGNLDYLDGAIVSAQPLTAFVLPEVSAEGFTRVSVSNTEADPASMVFELRRSDGGLRNSVSRTVAGNGSLNADLFADLFPGIAPVGSDYVTVRSSRKLAPFQLLGRGSEYLKILRGQNAAAGGTRLYSPQFVAGGGWQTEVSIVNLDETTGTVSVIFRDNDGVQLGEPQAFTIQPRGKILVDNPAALNAVSTGLLQGYLEITSSGPRLTGSVSFGDDHESRFASALPLVADLQKTQVFGHVASNGTYFTGLAILNPSAAATRVRIDVYNGNGELDFRSTQSIAPGQRLSALLTELFPGLLGQERTSGYVRVTSDLPVAAFALFGTSDLSVLSAIPGQPTP